MRRYLTPTLLGAHLLALVCVGAAGWLGVWQLDAWQERRVAEARDLTQTTPEPLTDVMGPDDPFPGDKVGQPVTVRGTWLTDSTTYVSGREHDGRTGFWVLTPLTVGGPGDPALPIVRGWVAAPGTAPAPPAGPGEVTAWLQPSEGTGAADDDPGDDVLPQVRTADLVQRVDQDLYGAYAVATEPGPGLERATLEQLPSAGRFTALRNLLYAIEWWFFGAFAAFIWWRYVRETAYADAAAAAEPAAPAAPRAARRPSRSTRRLGGVKLFGAYRVLALVVGVLLAFCALVALPTKYLATDGSGLQDFGESVSVLWLVHGWVFMIYVVVAFLLSRRAGWTTPFTLLMLVAGLVPLLIFWVERQVTRKVRTERPDLVGPSTA